MNLPECRAELVQPAADHRRPRTALPPDGNVKLRDYRVLDENLRAYTPAGVVHTPPGKGEPGAWFDACGSGSSPRHRILELVRPGDPGREALEAIVRPAPRRGLARPLDEDARRFLRRALLTPSPCSPGPAAERAPAAVAPEPRSLAEELQEADGEAGAGRGPAHEAEAPEAPEAADALGAAARRLDALLAESRALHAELAAIHEDLQVLARRATRPRL